MHRLDERGGADLAAAKAVKELAEKALAAGTEIVEPRPGLTLASGVLTVLGPSTAYFGRKDFQQLVVVRRMAADLDLAVEVVGCPVVRERAMSASPVSKW